MDTWVSIIMIVLFIVLLIFIFSIALLTPIIGKKNLLFVIFLGFMIGAVGGAFFISPVYEDVPQMARGLYQLTSDSPEIIMVDVSTNIDLDRFISDVQAMEGVGNVESSGIIIRTDNFTQERQKMIEERIAIVDPNIESYEVYTNGTIILNVKKGHNPIKAIKTLSDWLMLTGGISTRYSNVHVRIEADPSQVDNLANEISKEEVVVTSVKGPVQEQVSNLREMMPGQLNVILFCGILGMITGLAGIFIDNILIYLQKIKDKFRKEE
ncbi:hypothetical protein HYG87_01215 [Methanobacterium alkalithermotolerans]|uniref:Uncharacterized protein n=1 Tax=Methanobacterium alkalithermotolerans TaxID=2731220 RepID=A0A8T8K3J1_9EURY|nr:hypothetical protein [Methanobacterium alkalithermotolerans]QUH22479.1 hypothetical protein HYG87_01215 [Methanobacterium alkalithermotolerans]